MGPDFESNLRYLDGLAKFLSLKGNTLLIKGYAGAGKTTLSLQLLQQLAKDGSGIYISSRVSQEKVGQHLPWMKDGKIAGQKYKFIDIRLGTASSILEELTGVINSRGGGKKASVIVLDTWDALAKEMEEKERLKAEKMLITLADSSKARIIFVSEEPGRTTMDYLVDGIIELVRSEEHERIFREVEVQKLRGTLVDQHKYLYTLVGGIFRHLQPYAPPTISDAKRFDPIGDLDFAFSFGSESMDSVFGGLRKGSTFALEYNEKIPYTAIRTIEITMAINALNAGHGVFLIPLPGASTQGVTSLIEPFVSHEVFSEGLAIATMGGQESLKPPFHSLNIESPRKAAANASEIIGQVRKNSKLGDVVVIESVGQLESTFASNMNGLLEGIAARVSHISQESADGMLLTLQSDSQIKSRVLAMCRGYARLFVKDRSVVLLGEKPATEAFVLEHSEENSLIPKLTRIV
jgi:KaiC/GvpD/RAD55 family RecA-like ATPase